MVMMIVMVTVILMATSCSGELKAHRVVHSTIICIVSQVLQSLDMLRRAPKHTMSDLESNDCITALHTLFSMTLVPVGKCAVAHVLSLDENIASLLPFVEPRSQ